ncbi:MAG: hypothetical protein ACFE92_17915 [Promethearchaeota archaeon]
MSDTIHINPKSLNLIKKRLSWDGNGEHSNPIVIDSLRGLKEFIKFKKISMYVLIKDIALSGIQLVKCMNITIDNCSIAELTLTACSNITVTNSKIVDGNLVYCRNSTFKDNILDRDYANYRFNEKGSKQSDNGQKYLQKIFIPTAIIVITLSIIGFVISDLLTGFFFLIAFLIPLSIITDIRIKKGYTKNLGPNTFENNKTDTLREVN